MPMLRLCDSAKPDTSDVYVIAFNPPDFGNVNISTLSHQRRSPAKSTSVPLTHQRRRRLPLPLAPTVITYAAKSIKCKPDIRGRRDSTHVPWATAASPRFWHLRCLPRVVAALMVVVALVAVVMATVASPSVASDNGLHTS